MDAIVHDACMLTGLHGTDQNYIMVLIDAKNAFNRCSRRRMLDALSTRMPSLSRFIDAMYARTTPQLVVPSDDPVIIQGFEGTQQGDPASMLLFSITIQPLLRWIAQACNLSLHKWYADDGLLIGTIQEVKHALQILRDESPVYQFYLNVTKTKAYWPTQDPHKILD